MEDIMLSHKQLLIQSHNVNDKLVYGSNIRYYLARTDTAASCEIDGVQYHFFDGTTGITEWISNFKAIRTGIHGSSLGYDEIAQKFFTQIVPYIDPSKKQVFSGFSRGGAIAMLVLIRVMTYLLNYGKTPNCELVSFNMPKAGGKKLNSYCRVLGFNHTRIYMKGDIGHNILWWWETQYATTVIALDNHEKGIVNKHKNILPYL